MYVVGHCCFGHEPAQRMCVTSRESTQNIYLKKWRNVWESVLPMCDVLRRCAPRWTPAVGRGRASFYSPRAQVSLISWRLMSANCPLRLDSFQDNGRGITLSFFLHLLVCSLSWHYDKSLSALLSLFSAVCLILSVLKIALGTSNLVLLTRTELTA